MKTHVLHSRRTAVRPKIKTKKTATKLIDLPRIGQSVAIASGLLAGLVGEVSEHRGRRVLVAFPACGPSVFAILAPAHFGRAS